MRYATLTFDAAPSARSVDANGFLHVASSHITKATVNPYYGREIPGWERLGLDPERIYYGFRAPEELSASLPTWEGLPLHIEHHPDSADEPEKLTRVGAVGKAVWNAPYIDAPLTVWDREAIDAIRDGSFRELSCAYRYEPDFTPGRHEGVEYEFIMRHIRGNHVALVEEGRAGPDVVVADAALQQAWDGERWITVHPNGANHTGRPALIDTDTGEVKAGMGGKFNGRNIDDIPRGKAPQPVPEEKYQARQARQTQIAGAGTGARGGAAGGNTQNAATAKKKSPQAKKAEIVDHIRTQTGIDLADKVIGQKNGFTMINTTGLDRNQLNAIRQLHRNGFEVFDNGGRGLAFRKSDTREQASQGNDASGKTSESDGKTKGYDSRLLESTAPDTARFQEMLRAHAGNHKKAAREYFKEKLQGRHVEARTDSGTIEAAFTGSGWGEIKKDMSQDPVKAELVPHMPDIISTGKYAAETPANAHADVKQFHTYRKTVETSAGAKEAIVDVAERPNHMASQPEHQVYSLSREGTPAYEKRQKESAPLPGPPGRNRGRQGTPTQDSAAVHGENIGTVCEVVNVRLAERPAAAIPGDHATTHKPNLIKGAVMRVKNWFRGAKDADPGIERQEVDLAQAIIDLHKIDPTTGEIVDITEDEDKAAEIRKLMGELSSKLEPDEVKKLTDALNGLAYSKATGDAEPGAAAAPEKGNAVDEDLKQAMDKCGLDADDEDAQEAFAEGVKYGEALMRDPAEREKLDREHESEGMRKAMDSCGLDAENPQESRAFAEGVKYGEKLERNPEERKKLDAEHEAEGAKKDMGKDEDKAAAIRRILDEVPGLTPEQRAKLETSLSGLAYAPATGDADLTAQDAALRRFGRSRSRGPRPLMATDAALIEARAVAKAQENQRAIARAVRDVRPLVGELDVLAFDSAANVYGYALTQSGVDARAYSRSAWRGMVEMLLREKRGLSGGRPLAQDRAPAKFDGPFAGLSRINIG